MSTDVHVLNTGVDPQLLEVVSACLALEPRRRPSGRDLAKLSQFIGALPEPAPLPVPPPPAKSAGVDAACSVRSRDCGWGVDSNMLVSGSGITHGLHGISSGDGRGAHGGRHSKDGNDDGWSMRSGDSLVGTRAATPMDGSYAFVDVLETAPAVMVTNAAATVSRLGLSHTLSDSVGPRGQPVLGFDKICPSGKSNGDTLEGAAAAGTLRRLASYTSPARHTPVAARGLQRLPTRPLSPRTELSLPGPLGGCGGGGGGTGGTSKAPPPAQQQQQQRQSLLQLKSPQQALRPPGVRQNSLPRIRETDTHGPDAAPATGLGRSGATGMDGVEGDMCLVIADLEYTQDEAFGSSPQYRSAPQPDGCSGLQRRGPQTPRRTAIMSVTAGTLPLAQSDTTITHGDNEDVRGVDVSAPSSQMARLPHADTAPGASGGSSHASGGLGARRPVVLCSPPALTRRHSKSRLASCGTAPFTTARDEAPPSKILTSCELFDSSGASPYNPGHQHPSSSFGSGLLGTLSSLPPLLPDGFEEEVGGGIEPLLVPMPPGYCAAGYEKAPERPTDQSEAQLYLGTGAISATRLPSVSEARPMGLPSPRDVMMANGSNGYSYDAPVGRSRSNSLRATLTCSGSFTCANTATPEGRPLRFADAAGDAAGDSPFACVQQCAPPPAPPLARRGINTAAGRDSLELKPGRTAFGTQQQQQPPQVVRGRTFDPDLVVEYDTSSFSRGGSITAAAASAAVAFGETVMPTSSLVSESDSVPSPSSGGRAYLSKVVRAMRGSTDNSSGSGGGGSSGPNGSGDKVYQFRAASAMGMRCTGNATWYGNVAPLGADVGSDMSMRVYGNGRSLESIQEHCNSRMRYQPTKVVGDVLPPIRDARSSIDIASDGDRTGLCGRGSGYGNEDSGPSTDDSQCASGGRYQKGDAPRAPPLGRIAGAFHSLKQRVKDLKAVL